MWSPRRGLLPIVMLLLPIRVAAQEERGLRYSAPPECPERSVFIQRAQSRTKLATFVSAATPDPFVVSIEPKPKGFVGRLSREGREPRVVTDDSCEDVAEALALMLALAIDPAAIVTVEAQTATEIEATRPPPSTQPAAFVQETTAVQEAPRKRFFVGVWARAARTEGLAPDTLTWWSGSLGVEALWNASRGLAPTVRIGLLGAGSKGAADARFRLLAMRAELAAPRLVLGPFALLPVLGFELGGIHARSGLSGETAAPAARTLTWLALTQALHVELSLRKLLYFVLIGALREPLHHYRFVLSSPAARLRVATVEGVELSMSVGIGVRF